MNETVKFGSAPSEKISEENEFCRKLVREIANIGITERQRLFLIHALSMELENVEQMQAISGMISANWGDQIFVSKMYGD